MATKKQEEQINRLYSEIKTKKLSQDLINQINLKGFLYSCSRLNVLQITAFLAIVAKDLGFSDKEIFDLLEK